MTKIEEYNYQLPGDLIASVPANPRDASRLLVFQTEKNKISHQIFSQLEKFLKPGDLIVTNNSRVMPARIIGRKKTGLPANASHQLMQAGGKVEILLLNQSGNSWQVLIGGRTKIGDEIKFSRGLSAKIIQKNGKEAEVRFNISGNDFWLELDKIGITPIPPYIEKKLKGQSSKVKIDENYLRKEYQTVYAKDYGSAAAPTAGLHFTEKLISDLKACGINFASVDLHVGLGTFAPIDDENVREKKLHNESFSIPASTIEKIIQTKNSGGRIIAVGTTTVRALESAAADILSGKSFSGTTDIFIQPGDKFQIIDGLITNFHLPKSSLMMLVAAFIQSKTADDGREKLLEIYQTAIEKKYRFYSFGDSMFVV